MMYFALTKLSTRHLFPPPGTSVTLVVGPISEHCTFQYLP
jgi:hypothetical protein